ncbi:3-methyl-2-oxobutanoate hydroxymethyltransferase [Xanthobacter sp. V3C-3]|uniref:3-methyl-2-oxobutanoate hydroxymethyltransferase n=1 Tax=Xanthobacter lutulentifluminis TaxID=3119935 RepID=UPI0037278393
MQSQRKRQLTPDAIKAKKAKCEPITLLTAYDYPMARAAHLSEIDIIFASDAFAMVGLGRPTTTSVTVDEVIYHTKAVRAGSGASLVLASLPFLSHGTPEAALSNAGRLIQEGGAHAVEIEGGSEIAPMVEALVRNGIATIAHIGLTKQIIARTGSHRSQGRDIPRAVEILNDALTLEKAGAFALILECVPDRLAKAITAAVSIPTIGIGAGPHCDGQGLVSQDMLGLYDQFCPKFVKQYAGLLEASTDAFAAFREEVSGRTFPPPENTTSVDAAWEAAFREELGERPAAPSTPTSARPAPQRSRSARATT